MHLLLYHPSFLLGLNFSFTIFYTPSCPPCAPPWMGPSPAQCRSLITPQYLSSAGATSTCRSSMSCNVENRFTLLRRDESRRLEPPPLPASILHSSIVSHHIVEQAGIALDHPLPTFPRRVTQLKRTDLAEVKGGLPSRRITALVAVILFRGALMFRHVLPRFAVYIWTIIC